MNRYIRSIFSVTTITLMIVCGNDLSASPLMWFLLGLATLVYLVMIWIDERRLTLRIYGVATGVLIALAGTFHLMSRDTMSGVLLLIPLVLLLAREQARFAIGLAGIILVVMTLVAPVASYAVTALPGVVALYVGIRAINLYKTSYQRSQQDMEALNEAHHELQRVHVALQDATLQSMRYAALAERTRVAQDIHDGLGHQLTSLIVQLQALEIMLPNDPIRAAHEIPGMLQAARKAMGEVRLAVRTAHEDEGGLGLVAVTGLISQFATSTHIQPTVQQADDLSEWSAELSVTLYRVVQEALTNIMRHAQATAVAIELCEDGQRLLLTIADDGCFMATEALVPGFGLRGMRERVREADGTLELTQNQPHGLIIRVTLPLVGQNSSVNTALPLTNATPVRVRREEHHYG